MRTLLLLVSCWAFALANNERVTYEGYKVYKIYPTSVQQVDFLKSLENELHVDYWTISKLANQPAVALVDSKNRANFEIALKGANIKWNILIEDVQTIVDQEQLRQRLAPKVAKGEISFDQYHKYQTMVDYIEKVAVDNPRIAFQESIGQSTEYTNIKILSICKNECGSNPKIFIECGIHAREWISPPVCLYIIQELVQNPNNSALIDNVDWHIVPVMNVDGYEYSQKSRFWRKTRSLNDKVCIGVDADRNFNFKFEPITENKCLETYQGAEEETEPEVKAVADRVKDLNNENAVELYLSIQSYGQYILYPFSYTDEVLPPSNDTLEDVGKQVAEAIGGYRGSNYIVGNYNKIRHKAHGTSLDWASGREKIKLAYTIELPGGGSAGFDLPPEKILGVVQETFEGIKEFHKIIEALP